MTKIVWLVVLASSISVFGQRYEVVIDEIMSDPSPAVGLPGVEWIELRNASGVAVSVLGWRIADASTLSGPFSSFTLLPDSTVIICSNASALLLNSFGRVLPVTSFPSLDNDGELIVLKDHLSRTVHAVSYQKKWFNNSVKQEGGWSLEMIDPTLPCAGQSNWQASVDPSGGSPGRINSINNTSSDNVAPELLRGYAPDSVTFILVFDEPLDSGTAIVGSNYSIDPAINILRAEAIAPTFDRVKIVLGSAIPFSMIYKIEVSNLKDCELNEINRTIIPIGLANDAQPMNIVINEVLFDNPPATTDYIELMNRSNYILDLGKLYVTNRNNGVLSPPTRIASEPFLMFPGDYIVMTEDQPGLSLSYHVKFPDRVLVSPVPSLPDTEGILVLLNSQGEIIDELHYKDDWHFALLDDKEGIALERISAALLTNDKNNWSSASYSAGFGTPGYANSQSLSYERTNSKITLQPSIVSPDNDGRDDHVRIMFDDVSQGSVANVYVFDVSGKMRRHLLNNKTISSGSFIKWDGLAENHVTLPSGVYILLTEIFDPTGKVEKHKTSVVVVGRIN